MCRTFNEFEFCKDEKTCNYRHPRKICKFWSGMSHCKMGDLCKFRHPVIRPESDNQHQHSFLDRRTNKPKYRSPENQRCQALSTEKSRNVESIQSLTQIPSYFPFPPPCVPLKRAKVQCQSAVNRCCSQLQGVCNSQPLQ